MARDSSLCIILVSFSILAWLSACDGNIPARNCSESDREALIDFKNGLEDIFDRLSSWQGNDCCRWQGIGCDERTGGITSIDVHGDSVMRAFRLSGEIRPSLARLKSLRFLDLSSNNFDGLPIPEFVGSLVNLRYLNLSSAGFDGGIPPNLGNLSNLQSLDLSSEFSTSKVNNLGWISGLSSLKYLALDGVDLSMVNSMWISVLNGFPSLSRLHLSRCHLSGSISSLGLVNFTSLAILDLGHNNYDSEFPQWLPNVSSLVSVDMSYNDLYGRIPLGLGELPRLQILILSGNYLSASCTQLFQGSWKRIKVMDLALNKIHGRLPTSIGKMTTLSDFDLSDNLVRGGIPSSIGSLCSLVNFDLSNNNLTGSLPEILQRGSETCDSLSSLPNLRYLSLSKSWLRGYLPSWVGQLKNLEKLTLDYNFLEGPIPSLGTLKKVTILNLRGNQLNGTLPIDLGQLSELHVLDVSFNHLSGTLSEGHFANLRKMETLVLSSNSFTLNVSADWMPSFQVTELGMGSCQIGPSFPAWLRHENEIQYLDFSNASISGPVPSWFWDISISLSLLNVSLNLLQGQLPHPLQVAYSARVDLSSNLFRGPFPILPISAIELLDLSNNQFSGGIPQDLSENMPSLSFLSLSSNKITGGLPESIGEMQWLHVIDLSNNNLSGSIPPSIGNCSRLEVLDLQNNSLSGLIPASLGQLQGLQSLHLSNNKLSGDLPSSFKNLSSLGTLDIGNNQLSGTIPAWMAEGFIKLRTLSLRSNAFSGEIPHELSNLSSLQVLDLAENNLTGKIPSSFGDLKAMVKVQERNEYLLYGDLLVGVYYEENFLVTTKGQRLSYTKTLSLLTCIDISGNNLDGEFPEEMTKLGGLLILNLSRNGIGGQIPESISGMSQLLSLDLSSNKLSGAIPHSMPSMSFLSCLNLSDNNFSGKIPYTQQMTTFNPSSYSGNPGLCGAPLNVTCPPDEPDKPGTTEDGGGDNEFIDQWFYLSVGLGYAVGILIPAVVLHIKSSWADAYFDFIDRIVRRWLPIGNKRAKLRRNRRRGRR